MHEFAIAQDIIFSLEKSLGEDFGRISRINIEVGSFSGIVSDSLKFGLETLLKTENVKGRVDININEKETTATCECGNEYKIETVFDLCPVCHSSVRDIGNGMNIFVDSVEIKEAN